MSTYSSNIGMFSSSGGTNINNVTAGTSSASKYSENRFP